MIDDNPFEASTPTVVPDMSPGERIFGPTLSLFEPPSVTDPVSNLDFLPVDDAFALEMRSETIEQLVGGDALRRGESERIEAGRSQTNADLVAGRDRVRVHATLREHTGHGLAEQAAHLHTTVDGTLDVHAGSEDTVLLAGHMSDLWDGGAAIVAAMTDDTAAGGGIRVTTPLDLWVHGLMGVEERIGTCTADAVLMESSATHYEREYGPGVHAAGLAVYTGSLYQSSRTSFRPLMRVSSGVRNLIAGGDGGGGGGDAGAGGAPVASPPPAPAAGGAGTQAASETLCAATGAGGTAQAGVVAGVRAEDLAGIHRVDEVAALARGANVAGDCGDLSELRRGTDTAGQLAALRDAMRGGEAGPQGEVTNVLRVSEPDDTASVHEASALDIVGDIRSGATGPDLDVPVSPCAVLPRKPPPGVKLGLLGGGGGAVRPGSSDIQQWQSGHTWLHREYSRHRRNYNWIATRAFGDAISTINGRLIEAYVEFGGRIDALRLSPFRDPEVENAYPALQVLARQADRVGEPDRASAIEEILASLDRLTVEFIGELGARTDEFDRAYDEVIRISFLDPRIDAKKVTDWIDEQIGVAECRRRDARRCLDVHISLREGLVLSLLGDARRDVSGGGDPRVGTYNRIRFFGENASARYGEVSEALLDRLMEAMADPSMHRPAVQAPDAGGATPQPFRTMDSGAAGRLGEIPRVPGPSSSATAGTDAGDLGRGMLDQPVVGPAGEMQPGAAAPRSGDAQAMVNSQRGSAGPFWFWLPPIDPVPAPDTVRFGAGLQRAGPLPPHSGEAATGGTAALARSVPSREELLDPGDLVSIPSWSEKAFHVERCLIAESLPSEFYTSRVVSVWDHIASDTNRKALRDWFVPTPRVFDSLIERLRAEDGGRGHYHDIQNLEVLKGCFDRALTNQYGSRADADWLAKVEEFLKSGSAAQAVGVAPVSVPSRGEDIVEGARTSLQPLRGESAAAPGPTEWGARELSPGAWSPAQDPWGLPWSRDGSDAGELSPGAISPAQRPSSPWSQDGSSAGELSPRALSPMEYLLSPRPQVRFGEDYVVRLDATQPVSGLGAGGRGVAAGPTAGWQAAATPGFGRLAPTSAELAFSHREGIVHRLVAGEAVSAAPRSELIRRYERAISAGTIAAPAPRARTAAALFEDLGRLFTAARVSPASAVLEDIDWAAIELMLRLLDAPGL